MSKDMGACQASWRDGECMLADRDCPNPTKGDPSNCPRKDMGVAAGAAPLKAGQPATLVFTFADDGDFRAMYAAERFLSERGFSVGHSERGAPRGILLGDFDIQKWRNLNAAERAECDGTMTGDMRRGPVTIIIRGTGMHGPAALAKAQS